jgi:CRP-like cAMP-binding protein
MIEIKHPSSVWLQMSSFCFFLAGNYSDLLIIRLALSSAYVFLLVNCSLGAPLWPLLRLPGYIQLDGILWAVLNLYVHISTVVRLLNDERPAQLTSDEQALWRMFYRTGGLSQKLFKDTVAKHCEVVTFKQGQEIRTDEWFYIVYKGAVKITVSDDNGAFISSRKAQSGQLFDFRDLGLLQDVHKSLARQRLEGVVAISEHTTLFRFPKHQIAQIASHPSTRLMWKELLMENLLRIVQRYFDKRIRQGLLLDDSINGECTNPIFLPLEKWEEPNPLRAGSGLALKTPFMHMFASMGRSFSPPWPWKGPPAGLRHAQLPAPGPVQNVSPQKLQDSSESQFLLPSSIASNHGTTTEDTIDISGDEEFFEYLCEIDEEMGGH